MPSLFDAARAMPSDREARFRIVHDELYPRVRRYVARQLGATAQPDDVAQETFAKLWQEMLADREPRTV